MSFTPTPYMGLPVPPVGESGPEWSENINDSLDLIDAHDHTSGKGAQIPSAGLNINSDLEFNGNNATELNSTRYSNLSSVLVGALDKNCLYFVGGNLYINNNSGTSVQLTNGSSINLSTVGTIGGDYGQPGVNASVVYSNTLKTFTFTQEPTQAAKMALGDLSVYDPTLAGSNPVTVKVDGTVSAGYDFYLPLSGPTANQVYRQNAASDNAEFVTVQGTSNQVTITHAAGSITSSLPSSIIAPGSLTTTTTLSSTGNFAVNTNKFTVTASSGDAYSAGNLTVAGNSALTGDLAVNTNKFTVASATGNTLVAGTLNVTSDVAVNTNKFTVAASSGNTVVAGTLNVTGAITGPLAWSNVTSKPSVNTTAPLAGGGSLSSDLTLSMPAATSSQNGYLTSTDWSTFNNKPSFAAGTWTPVFKTGATTESISGLAAEYYKVGRLVFITCRFTITKSGTGNVSIEGLPFAADSSSNLIQTIPVWTPVYWQTTTVYPWYLKISPGGTSGLMYSQNTTATASETNITNAYFVTGAEVRINACYLADS